METPKKPIKICQVVVLSHLTGVQRSTLQICQHLDPERFESHLICKDEGPLTEELDRLGIAYHLVPELDRPIHPVRDLQALLGIRRICREQQFDLVHTHSSKSGFLGRVAARWAGVPNIVHHVRGYAFHEFSGKPKRLIYSRLEKIAARFCDRVIFCNDEERVMSIENKWIPAEKCVTIYNGADLELFDSRDKPERREAFRRDQQLEDDEVAILVGGRFYEQKQPQIIPRIAQALDKLLPDKKWRILMAGEGELEEDLRNGIRELKMGDRVKLIGWYSHPEQLVAGCDINLLASLWEGLPRVLIESQAAGMPIVASNINGNREVVTEETGFLCSPKDPEAYAKALAKLVTDASLRTQMSIEARKRAEKEFDARQTVAKIIALYESLLQRGT